MTTGRSQDSRGTTRKRPSKVLFTKFVQKQASCNLLLFVLWDFVKCVITVQPTNNIKCIRRAKGHGWNKEFFFPNGRESEKRSAIVSTSRTDLFKTSAERGGACCNTTASHKAEGMNAHQIRAKATNGTHSKKRRWDSVFWACCSTVKSMVLGLEGCLIWCTNRSNKAQHRNRVNFEVTQSLNQAFGGNIDFQHSLYEFFGVLSNDEGPSGPIMVPTYLACRTICISRNS